MVQKIITIPNFIQSQGWNQRDKMKFLWIVCLKAKLRRIVF